MKLTLATGQSFKSMYATKTVTRIDVTSPLLTLYGARQGTTWSIVNVIVTSCVNRQLKID